MSAAPLPFAVCEYHCARCGTWRWATRTVPSGTMPCASCGRHVIARRIGSALEAAPKTCVAGPDRAVYGTTAKKASLGAEFTRMRADGWISIDEAASMLHTSINATRVAICKHRVRRKRSKHATFYWQADIERIAQIAPPRGARL